MDRKCPHFWQFATPLHWPLTKSPLQFVARCHPLGLFAKRLVISYELQSIQAMMVVESAVHSLKENADYIYKSIYVQIDILLRFDPNALHSKERTILGRLEWMIADIAWIWELAESIPRTTTTKSSLSQMKCDVDYWIVVCIFDSIFRPWFV